MGLKSKKRGMVQWTVCFKGVIVEDGALGLSMGLFLTEMVEKCDLSCYTNR